MLTLSRTLPHLKAALPRLQQKTHTSTITTMASLPTRQLGKGGPQVTALGFGAMGLSAFYGAPKPDPERFAVLDRAYALGQLNWDTSDAYLDNEDLIGAWFARNPGAREKIFLASKFAFRQSDDGSRYVDSSPSWVKQAVESSLRRLGVECLDLYYCHRLDGKTPIEQTVRAMAELKAEGKIKHLGLSEVSAESLRRACKVHHIAAVQIEYSPFSLDIENPQIDLLKTCRELGVATVAYSPIGRGMITGAIRSPDDLEEGDFRRNAPRFQPENFKKNLDLVDKICDLAKKKGVTASQLTLAWLMKQGEDIIPIPGTTKVQRVDENLGALEVKLTEEEDRAIRQACESAEVHGARYPEAMAAALFADSPPNN